MPFDPHKILNEVDRDALSDREKDMFDWIRHTFHKLAQHMEHHYDQAIRENNNATTSGDATWRETNARMDRIEVFLNEICRDQPDIPAARLWTAQKAKEALGLSMETFNINELLSRIIDDDPVQYGGGTYATVEEEMEALEGVVVPPVAPPPDRGES